MTEPTKADPDYYRHIKVNKRWYLIVPELYHHTENGSPHRGCAFHTPNHPKHECRLAKENGGYFDKVPLFQRHDCGLYDTIFVAPSKLPEYLAQVAIDKLGDDA